VPVRCPKAIPPFLPGKVASAGAAEERATAARLATRARRRITSAYSTAV
jgi:hypothetical protein